MFNTKHLNQTIGAYRMRGQAVQRASQRSRIAGPPYPTSPVISMSSYNAGRVLCSIMGVAGEDGSYFHAFPNQITHYAKEADQRTTRMEPRDTQAPTLA